eukprot:scaffold3046_cov105-Cylindrotheca_fusiformis.AAC.16
MMKTFTSVYLLLSFWCFSDSIHDVGAFSRPLHQFHAVGQRATNNAPPHPSVTIAPTSERSSSLCLFRRLRNGASQDVAMERSGLFGFVRALKTRSFWSQLRRRFRIRTLKQWLLACTIFLAASAAPAMARSGGRIGGTYSSPSRPSMSRPSRQSRRLPSSPRHSGPSRTVYHRPAPIYRAPIGYSTTTVVHSPFVRELHPRQVTASDVVLWTGTGLAVTYGVRNHYKHHMEDLDNHRVSPLGPGASVASITVALEVPDRWDAHSILKDLDQKALLADTTTRKGLQYVVSETALELLRRESSIVSVESSIKHYRTVRQAQVSYQQASIAKRSKLDRESASNIDGLKSRRSVESSQSKGDGISKATMAVVSLSLCIEGDSIFNNIKRTIRNRKDLRKALSRISSDVQVEDCLLSAEILWTPEEPNEVLSERDVYAEYPDLYPLFD